MSAADLIICHLTREMRHANTGLNIFASVKPNSLGAGALATYTLKVNGLATCGTDCVKYGPLL